MEFNLQEIDERETRHRDSNCDWNAQRESERHVELMQVWLAILDELRWLNAHFAEKAEEAEPLTKEELESREWYEGQKDSENPY